MPWKVDCTSTANYMVMRLAYLVLPGLPCGRQFASSQSTDVLLAFFKSVSEFDMNCTETATSEARW